MPTYEYNCQKCDKDYELIKSIKEYDGKDECPTCGNVGDRIFSANIQFIGASVQDAEYNPAFGQVVKNKRHRQELAKEKGMIEVGNENLHKAQDEMSKDKRKRFHRALDEA